MEKLVRGKRIKEKGRRMAVEGIDPVRQHTWYLLVDMVAQKVGEGSHPELSFPQPAVQKGKSGSLKEPLFWRYLPIQLSSLGLARKASRAGICSALM